jgi:hypothetical protein
MNSPTRATIVVGVDGSTSALHAALWGRRRGRPAAPSAAAPTCPLMVVRPIES